MRSEKINNAINATSNEIIRGLKKIMLFNSSIDCILQNEGFTEFDIGLQLLDVETTLMCMAKNIQEIRQNFEK